MEQIETLKDAITRRQMLRRSTGALLALGLGATSARAGSAAPGFRFVVINDIHSRDERCIPWFRKIAASIHTHNPAFCLINGDLCENGRGEQLQPVRDIFTSLGVPLYATLGNHDYLTDSDHSAFDRLFPNFVNYQFQYGGWQFIGLDSTQGRETILTHIQPHTLAWLDATLPTLDATLPTVVFTHFPLGQMVLCRPLNADDLLARFDKFNLRATFSGHWHGYAERHFEHATVTNSRCGSWWRGNNDGSPQKGYFLCETTPSGDLKHRFNVIS